MAFAPSDITVDGQFRERDHGHLFEFSVNDDLDMPRLYQYPHKIWVTTPLENVDQGYRYGTVKKTVVHIVTDEDDYGHPIIERWQIKDLRTFN